MGAEVQFYVNVLTAIERIVAVRALTETEALERAAALPGVIRALEVFDYQDFDIGGEDDVENAGTP